MKPDTWIAPEEHAYPNGGFTRRGRAKLDPNPHNPIVLPYGRIRAVRASIPDTFFSIPARLRYQGKTVRGYLHTADDNQRTVLFTPEADPQACLVCRDGDGCKRR